MTRIANPSGTVATQSLVSPKEATHKTVVSALQPTSVLYRCYPWPPARNSPPREIEATDQVIDALVYELYGLTDEEIAIVEGRGR